MASPNGSSESYDLSKSITNATAQSPAPSDQKIGAQSSYVDYANSGSLTHTFTTESRLPAFGGAFQPGLYRPQKKVANPAPLGLSAFALSVFMLGCIEMGVRDITDPSILIGTAFAYGGVVQLLAGMWEMAVGNTFGATVLSSYGGFWISIGIVFTPGGFNVVGTLKEAGGGSDRMFYDAFGMMLMAWFIFTTLMLLCTLKSTVAFFLMFLMADLAILILAIGYLHRDSEGKPTKALLQAGGFLAILTSFLAWYNAFAGVADNSNTFFVPPVVHFPWSAKGRRSRRQATTDAECREESA